MGAIFEVVNVQERLILDDAGNPVDGYHLDFVTKRGLRGYVNIPKSRYTKEMAAQLVEAEAKKLEDMLGI